MFENCFSCQRLMAIMIKEFIQMRRDRLTFAMIIGIPLLQLILFGYAINSNPKNLPTVIVNNDHSVFTRTFIQAMRNTDYFRLIKSNLDEKEADKLLSLGKAQFAFTIPSHFSKDLVRGHRPDVLLTVDATDAMAASNAMAAASQLAHNVFTRDLQGPLAHLIVAQNPFNFIVHAKYNPELITQYNIVPGLMGVVLTMTMVIITALAVTRERERGTMESLLATPSRPAEVMLGKIVPYIIIGYMQVVLILLAAYYLFQVPIAGHLILIFATALPFIIANLSVGITFSTIADTQLQAVQMAVFFFLPSILLSGFMFPFYGMPIWAQWIGHVLPLTYFLRIVRGIVLKGNGILEILPHVWPIIIFMIIALIIGLMRYRKTLD
jgi:ABC-2 type transport system permease protein